MFKSAVGGAEPQSRVAGNADAVGFVDIEQRAGISLFDLRQVGEGSRIAVHAVDAFGDYNRRISRRHGFCREAVEVGGIVVTETIERQPRQLYAVDDACMHEFIGDDVCTGSGECRDETRVGVITAVENQRFAAVAVGFAQSIFESREAVLLARQQTRCRGAHLETVHVERCHEFAAQVEVVGQAEIVVRAEIDAGIIHLAGYGAQIPVCFEGAENVVNSFVHRSQCQ